MDSSKQLKHKKSKSIHEELLSNEIAKKDEVSQNQKKKYSSIGKFLGRKSSSIRESDKKQITELLTSRHLQDKHVKQVITMDTEENTSEKGDVITVRRPRRMDDEKISIDMESRRRSLTILMERRITREDLILRRILLDEHTNTQFGPFVLDVDQVSPSSGRHPGSLETISDDLFIYSTTETENLQPLIQLTNAEPVEGSLNFMNEAFKVDVGVDDIVPLMLKLERNSLDKHFYKKYFLNQEHMNYVGFDAKSKPVIVSVCKNPIQDYNNNNSDEKQDTPLAFRMIIRSKMTDMAGHIYAPTFSKAIKLMSMVNPSKYQDIKFSKLKKEGTFQELQAELVKFEEQTVQLRHKFGILYCKPGQTHENDMFGNVSVSKQFEEFLEFIGDKIKLKGWTGFRGGLDVKADTTGTYSLFTTYNNLELMFHVAPFLPYSPQDLQQLERKRHLGNDVCVIIFQDDDSTPFNPAWLTSEFNHVFFVIQCAPSSNGTGYRFAIATKVGVPSFGPKFPANAVFEKTQSFRKFLLTKLINAERSAMYAPNFAHKVTRTRETILREIIDMYKTKS